MTGKFISPTSRYWSIHECCSMLLSKSSHFLRNIWIYGATVDQKTPLFHFPREGENSNEDIKVFENHCAVLCIDLGEYYNNIQY